MLMEKEIINIENITIDKYYLQEAAEKKCKTIITFGGAYSNHIIATAFAAKEFRLKSIGIIRGEEPNQLSHTLILAKEYGMDLIFISRSEYSKKDDDDFINDLQLKYSGSLIIPEGGAGINGIIGSGEIFNLTNGNEYAHILCAVGTATTFLGLANAGNLNQQIIGICVLKGMNDLLQQKQSFLKDKKQINNCYINYDYHFGGYAKMNDELFHFMNSFYNKTGIATDFVYTGKLFYAVFDLIKKDFFPPESKLLIIHSGGLQGNDSLPKGTLNFN
jgi:1-aminocyclopropane-1-carboxylate deaminase